ncbi:hypothetical protein VPNG_09670 [Cytospora leucostoma]|uniref:Uncharacterized protein n=1 Tax=Cytospora leucostoma TaxID=1230097 RepID=A0A423VMQ6_9PEZI|nr:hypothetical protein VPNG_09670 [Cytospora leucostoma]
MAMATMAPSVVARDPMPARLLVAFNVALAILLVIGLLFLLAGLVWLFRFFFRKPPATQQSDEEQGIELQNVAHQPSQSQEVLWNSNTQSSELAIAEPPRAYFSAGREYAQPEGAFQDPSASSASLPEYSMEPNAGSRRQERQIQHVSVQGRTNSGQQMYGKDYSAGGREPRFAADVHQSHNSNNNVDYGRRGNRFAHGI